MTTGGALPQTVDFSTTALSPEWDSITDRAINGRSYDDAGSGPQRWKLTATWPELLRHEWAPIRSFLSRQRGVSGRFTVIPPDTATPLGALSGAADPGLINGGFDADASWTKGTGWTIGGGVATHASGAASNLTQALTFVPGVAYLVTWTVGGMTGGGVRVRLQGGTTVAGADRTANGTYQDVLTAVAGNDTLSINAYNASFDGSIDNVSITVMDPAVNAPAIVNGDFATDSGWSKETGWTISGGKATHAAGAQSGITQAYSFAAGVSYEVTFTVSGRTAGSVRVQFTGGTTVNGATRSTNGTFTETLTAVSGNTSFGLASTSTAFDASVDDVSIRVVGEVLPVRGCGASVTNWLREGDVLKLAGHSKVYMATGHVDTDAAGNAAIPITPPLIEAPADGEALTLTDVPLTVRMIGIPRFSTGGAMVGTDYSVDLEEAWQ